MTKVFKLIGSIIEKQPTKVLLAALLVFVIMITGVYNMRMATGNETLVQEDNQVYITNEEMAEHFGSDSILVLFTAEDEEELLSLENMQKMWHVEQKMKQQSEVFSFMSPASIVHQFADTQSKALKEQILNLSVGLGEMSSQIIDIGSKLKARDLPDLQALEQKFTALSQLTQAFDELIQGQNSLGAGAQQLQGALLGFAEGLMVTSEQLRALGNMVAPNEELKVKLITIADNLQQSTQGLLAMGGKTSNFQAGTQKTAATLGKVSGQLTKETSAMKGTLSKAISPGELQQMANGFITMGEKLANISEALETLYHKSSMMVADIPADEDELEQILYAEKNGLRSIFSDVVLDEQNSLMVIKLQGNLDDDVKDLFIYDLQEVLAEEEFDTISYVVSGKPVLDTSLRTEMKANMMKMVALAVIIMLFVLSIVFRVKWRMLSLGIILASVMTTLGLMGLISVPITMVSMAVFPILIGLGIDYSIQFHNRYAEEHSVWKTTRNVGKAVFIAVLATVLGFVSLFASPVPMIQDFGKMLTIGVIISFIGSIFLLLPILQLRDSSKRGSSQEISASYANNNEAENETFLAKLLYFITISVMKFKIPILIVMILLAAFGFMADKKVGVETDIETFMPQSMDALQDIRLVRDTVGSTDQLAIYLKDENILSAENLHWIQSKTEEIKAGFGEKVVDIKSIDSVIDNFAQDADLTYEEYIDLVEKLPSQQAQMFVNEDKTKGVILINIEHQSTERLQKFVTELEQMVADSEMNVHVTGKSVLDVEMVKGLTTGRVKMTMIGLALVFFVLLIIYRNPIKALLPILPVAIIIALSSAIMYLLGIKYTPITSTLGALVLGMGTEMTIMLMERYLEERNKGQVKLASMIAAVNSIGKAIIASGLTTVGGFSVLILSDFIILQDFGLMTVINISLALFSTFVILPPVLDLLDRFILKSSH